MFVKAFQKRTFCHCTLCADIFLANGWFYYSFYGYKTPLRAILKSNCDVKKVHEYTSFLKILIRQYSTMAQKDWLFKDGEDPI